MEVSEMCIFSGVLSKANFRTYLHSKVLLFLQLPVHTYHMSSSLLPYHPCDVQRIPAVIIFLL